MMPGLFLNLWTACGGGAPPTPSAPYFDGVPAYPSATALCDTSRTFVNGQMRIRAFATDDPLSTVVEYYRTNHGSAIPQVSGPRLFVRGADENMLVIGPPGETENECGVHAKAGQTELVVTKFDRNRPRD